MLCSATSAQFEVRLEATGRSTMKAAVVTDFRSPLEIQEVPAPVPGPNDILVKVEASGLCHTDIHAARGEWPVKPQPPFIPGHEGIGRIEDVGSEVRSRHRGDRVAVAWLGYACGECRACIGGWETLCERQRNSGYSVNCAFAEYVSVPARFATRSRTRCRRGMRLR
jgi:propanol-preferring alcohol dehydrogenase